MSGGAAFLILFLAVVAFVTVCFCKFLDVVAETKAEGDRLAEYLRKQHDPSSLMDDSPEPLPERWETSGGHVVEFRPRPSTDSTDLHRSAS